MLNHEKAIMVNWCAYYCEWYSGGLYLTGQWYDKEKNNNCKCIYLCHYWALRLIPTSYLFSVITWLLSQEKQASSLLSNCTCVYLMAHSSLTDLPQTRITSDNTGSKVKRAQQMMVLVSCSWSKTSLRCPEYPMHLINKI